MDFRFMERANARRVQMDLFYDYRTNVELYPEWQKLLRDNQPKTLVFWGQNDIFFTPTAGGAYLRHLSHAAMHRLDSCHFAGEECPNGLSGNMRAFYEDRATPRSAIKK